MSELTVPPRAIRRPGPGPVTGCACTSVRANLWANKSDPQKNIMISKHDLQNLNPLTPESLNLFAAQSKIRNPKSEIQFAPFATIA
jgi:hypothetical protein